MLLIAVHDSRRARREQYGITAAPPLCLGECPPLEICADLGGFCAYVPTLSEWGILGTALVMFGGVLYLRRRRAERA